MKIQEIKNIILAKTELTTTKAHKKALRIALGHITLESVIGEESKTESLSKQKVWVDSSEAFHIGVTVASGNWTGLGGSWFTRKVINITENEMYGKEGEIKLNKKTIKVVLDSGNEWRLA
ncbi:hypothetical protein NVP1161O_124 [Vibrio phage 1.161.O._10N.261.48.C5]|nr:hypothetical protein NVP1161O_124 [Vibrio phage 1.161.O._10N.261.48.C5]